MNSAEILEAPHISPRDARFAAWEAEKRAFQKLLPALLPTHRGKFVAIHRGEVVESGDVEVAVGEAAYRSLGYVPIYVDLVTDQPRSPARI